MNHPKSITSDISRRDALKGLCTLVAASVLPQTALANTEQAKLRIAQIGIAQRGSANLDALLRLPNAEVVALVDVDNEFLAEAALKCPQAKLFSDYRILLKEMVDEIDAVLISTPDHMHAPMALAAMELGKHVYCEKPLAHNVLENRQLKIAAEKTGVVTQLGIQLCASIGQRMTLQYIQSGIIGKVSEVHVWSNKGWGLDGQDYWHPVSKAPETLDWNLWLGVAAERPFRESTFHPGQWRRMLDFGTGTLGDMGVHIFDTPFRALELTNPLAVKSTCRAPNGFSHPQAVSTEYKFPATAYTTESLKWVWHDGSHAPPVIPGIELNKGVEMPTQGCIYIGEKGILMMPHQSGPQTFPRELIRSIPRPVVKPRDHHGEWVDACLGNGKTSSPFSYGGPLCEALQIGVVANQFPGKTLEWDANALKVTNLEKANQYLSREYRPF